ncbi:MAG: hypothetical protein P1P71_09550 [Anaerosomatales bacterium]|nr:hypothetical protein [Anaerosomatales bacterium]
MYAVVVAIVSVLVLPSAAFAATAEKYLYPADYSVATSALGNYTKGKAETWNFPASYISVYGQLQYAAPGKSWTNAWEVLMPPNSVYYSGYKTKSTAGSWRARLDVYGPFNGQRGYCKVTAP